MKITKSFWHIKHRRKYLYIPYGERKTALMWKSQFRWPSRKIVVPDRDGKMTDVCLGFDSMEDYARDNASLGAVVGRVANRIKDGHFCLDGKEYQLAINNGSNHLHGGLIRLRFQALGRKDQG